MHLSSSEWHCIPAYTREKKTVTKITKPFLTQNNHFPKKNLLLAKEKRVQLTTLLRILLVHCFTVCFTHSSCSLLYCVLHILLLRCFTVCFTHSSNPLLLLCVSHIFLVCCFIMCFAHSSCALLYCVFRLMQRRQRTMKVWCF